VTFSPAFGGAECLQAASIASENSATAEEARSIVCAVIAVIITSFLARLCP
jgi:hypothetical protein